MDTVFHPKPTLMLKQGTKTRRTIRLKDKKLWLTADNGYAEIFIKVK